MSAASPTPSPCASPLEVCRSTGNSTAAIATRLLALLSAFLVLTGCSVVRPTARASDVQVVESLGETTRVDIVLTLTNPSLDEVELIEYTYSLALADGSGYSGKWAALRAIPPQRTIEARIPAIIPSNSVGTSGEWRVSGSVEFRNPQSFARILYEAGILHTRSELSGSGASIQPAS